MNAKTCLVAALIAGGVLPALAVAQTAAPTAAQATAQAAAPAARSKPATRPSAAEPAARGADQADIDRTQILGNRELPKVLYIVPWKKPTPGDLAGRPPVSVIDEALAPIDRDVFRRQVQYDAQTQAAPPAAAAR